MESNNGMPYRTLGKTGVKVSVIGLGGYHIGMQADENDSLKIIRTALDNGVNFLDNSWDYNEGQSEIRVGRILKEGGYRNKAFVMTKIDGQTKEAAIRQLEESLSRLNVDHVDLLQFHEVIRMDDPDHIWNRGGMQAVLDAQKAGTVRFIGFTGHKDPYIHLKMLNTCFANGFTPDTVQMPLNVMDHHYRSFEKLVLPVLLEHNIGVLGMKPMCDGMAIKSGLVSPVECLHYAMNLPTSVVITGCDTLEILQQAIDAARSFKPLTRKQVNELLSRTKDYAANGGAEDFKTTHDYDATYANPDWLQMAPLA
jgi:aryl-alcohol dehydrogenase-like predicted oxidoreductase